jgi:hemerythrin
MKLHGYPEYEIHKMKHEKMTASVLQYIEKLESGESVNLIDVFQYLKDWLKKHILQTDMGYSAFLNDKGVH